MGMKFDVVGAAEAAQILGVEVPRISRWRETGRMPPPVAELAATPVWRRVDIEKLRDEKTWKGRHPAPVKVVGLSEVASILGVDKSQIGRWRREGKFPQPVLDKRSPRTTWKPGCGLSATPLWQKSAIENFATQRTANGRARAERKADVAS